jgi:L-histidine N-alpha-methyltransferase
MRESHSRSELASHPHDRAAMLDEVLRGLSKARKEIPSKFFYDARGSELFELITELEEYYPTRTERALLERWIPHWVRRHRPAGLVELGAGSASKSRIVLDAMVEWDPACLYVPVDVSGDFLEATAALLRTEYGRLRVEPLVADMSGPIEIELELPQPTWFALLGSTIGNFTEAEASDLLDRMANRMQGEDRLLLGVDRRPGPHKSVARLERAYNDAEGVTAEFNLNVLAVLNRELGADFDLEQFRHVAFYDPDEGRIEMHLVARSDQRVSFAGGRGVRLAGGESIRTEISCKYDRPTVARLLGKVGLEIDGWVEDHDGLFALVLGRLAR